MALDFHEQFGSTVKAFSIKYLFSPKKKNTVTENMDIHSPNIYSLNKI
jgi:hypothetical protein